jgi:NAD(P)-dependent dehydrogenase (short-subunit alcohol dehydrogenase family)
MSDAISVRGQVAVVTGAGRGIGRAHALELARRGAAVVVNDVVPENADAVVAEIHAIGEEAIANSDDVSRPEGGVSLIGAASERFGKVEIVINNAGILRGGYFEDLDPTVMESVVSVNLMSAVWVTHAAWPLMQQQRYGRVLVTSSGSGMFAHHGLADYAASKAGLYGLTKALAYEGREHGILVNAVLPMAAGKQAEVQPIPDRHKFPPIPALTGRTDPALATAMAVYLVSPGCSVTGEAFSTLGARYARVSVSLARGWVAPIPEEVSPEAIRENLDEVRAMDDALLPENLFDEMIAVNDAVASA